MPVDIGSSETPWIGNFAEKLENVCSDRDSINCQESIRYIGHQLAVAGNHVFQFWSKVFQDHLRLMEREVYDSCQTPESVVVQKELSNENPSPRGNFKNADEYLHDYVVLGQKTAVGNEESCQCKSKSLSMPLFDPVELDSHVEDEASKPLDVDSLVLDESCESKSLDDGGSSDGNLSMKFEENEEFQLQTQADYDALSADGVSNDGNLSTEVGEIKEFEQQTQAEDLDAFSDDGVSNHGNLSMEVGENKEFEQQSQAENHDAVSDDGVCSDGNLSTFSTDVHPPDMFKEPSGSDLELCNRSVESEEIEGHSDSGTSDVSSTEGDTTDEEDACAKVLIVDPEDSATTESVMDHHVTEEGTETDQLQLNKMDVDESLTSVDSHGSSSIRDSEEVVSDSKEVGKNKEFEQQTEAEDLDASSDDGVSCDDNLSTFSTDVYSPDMFKEPNESAFELCNRVESEGIEAHTDSGESDISSTKEVTDQEGIFAKVLVDLVDSTITDIVMARHTTEEGAETDQSQLNKLDDIVSGNKKISVNNVEEVVSNSTEFVETNEFVQQAQAEDLHAENQEDACSKLLIVDPVDSATMESVMDHYFAEEGTESDQSELNKLDVDESLNDIDSSDSSSVRDLEDIVSDSTEFEETKDFETQTKAKDIGAEQDVTSGWDIDTPSIPSLESVVLDDLCDDWIVL